VWKDAVGTVVPRIIGVVAGDPVGRLDTSAVQGTRVLVADVNGYFWRVNPYTLAVDVAFDEVVYEAWESKDCTGAAHLNLAGDSVPLPLFTFKLYKSGELRVVKTTAKIKTLQVCSHNWTAAACGLNSACPSPRTAIALADTAALTSASKPDLSTYVAPLHPEVP